MKNRFFLSIFALIFIACHGSNFQKSEDCGNQITKALGHINNFYFKKQPIYLDSALQILKGVENCSPKYTNIIFMDEMQVYFFKKDFISALAVLNKVPATVFPFPSLKDVFENKIRAKEAETKGDTISQRKYYCNIISLYQQYINQNNQLFINTLRQTEYEKIGHNEIDFVITELYYYISETEGVPNAINKLINFQKNIQGNVQYFEELKKDINKNDPHSMGILLY